MTIDLVLARFNEDVSWIPELTADLQTVIYNKGDGPEPRLPNVGREAHTYLHHMVRRYTTLADWTFFTQADPLPHCPNFDYIVSTWPDSYRNSAFYVAPDQNFFSDQPVRFIEKEPMGDDALNDCAGLWGELFESPMPEGIVFAPGAIFAITREKLLTRSLAFYQRALELAATRPRGPWEFERIWAYLWTSSAVTKL